MPTLQSAIDAATNGLVVLDPAQVYTVASGQPAKIVTSGVRIVGRGARVVKDTLEYPSLVIFADGVRVEGVRFEGAAPPTLRDSQPQSFTGATLPAIGLSLPFSVNPFDCGWAQVVTAGDNITFTRNRFTGAFGVAMLPHRSGRRARNNRGVWNQFYDYVFGFNAYGQERLTYLRTYGERPLQPSTVTGPLAVANGIPPGHLIYLAPGTGATGNLTNEECWSDDVFINHVIERTGTATPISTLYTSLKLNNVHGLRVGNVRSVGVPSCLDFLGCDGYAWNINQSGGYMSDDPGQWATFRWAVVLDQNGLAPGNREAGTMTIEDSTFAPDGEGVKLYRSERPGLTLRNVSFPTSGDQDPPVIYAGSTPTIE
jgi:hypothetical protein